MMRLTTMTTDAATTAKIGMMSAKMVSPDLGPILETFFTAADGNHLCIVGFEPLEHWIAF